VVTSLSDSAIYASQSLNLADSGTPEQVNALMASPSLFSLLQCHRSSATPSTEADAKSGATKTAVLSYSLWRAHFAGDSAVLGHRHPAQWGNLIRSSG